MRIEVNVNNLGALKVAQTLEADSIACGDDACAIRCALLWKQLTPSVIARTLAACPTLYLVTPQLLTGAEEVSRVALRAVELIEAGFTGLIINNIGLMEAMRRCRPDVLDRVTLIAGRRINVYNSRDLAVLARMGFRRATVHIELSADGIAALRPPDGLTLGMLGYGPLSLAYSRMCYVMSLKGKVDYDRCGIACERESLDLGATGEKPVFRLYGREIQSARRFCAAHALPRLAGHIGVLEVYLPGGDAGEELAAAIALLKAAASGEIGVSAIDARERAVAAISRLDICNGALFGLPGAAHTPDETGQTGEANR